MYKNYNQSNDFNPMINYLRYEQNLPLLNDNNSFSRAKYPIQNTSVDYQRINNLSLTTKDLFPSPTQYFMLRDDSWNNFLTK